MYPSGSAHRADRVSGHYQLCHPLVSLACWRHQTNRARRGQVTPNRSNLLLSYLSHVFICLVLNVWLGRDEQRHARLCKVEWCMDLCAAYRGKVVVPICCGEDVWWLVMQIIGYEVEGKDTKCTTKASFCGIGGVGAAEVRVTS